MKISGKATVLMPVYNGEKYLETAINSILNQTFKNFKLLIINDGSSDKSAEIIKNIQDERIIYIENEKNLGIVRTLNKGLSLIDSEYILRMDSDDIAHSERLAKQIEFMDDNSNVAVSGTGATEFFEGKQKKRKKVIPLSPNEIRSELFFNSPLLHPTVIIRNEVIKKEAYKYQIKYTHSEDYGLWQEIAVKYDLANLKEALLDYRVHSESITQVADKKLAERDTIHQLLYKDYMNTWDIALENLELKLWRKFNSGKVDMTDKNELIKLDSLIDKIKSNLDWTKFDLANFDRRASFRFRFNSVESGFSPSKTIKLHKEFIHSFKFNRKEKAKLYIKHAIKTLRG